MADNPSILSINEPQTVTRPFFTPVSVNEPPPLPDLPPPGVPTHPDGGVPDEATPRRVDLADPDEMEDEIEQAEDDGEFTAVHKSRK